MKTRLLTILMMLGVLQSAMAYTLTVVSGENGSTETKWMGVTGSNSETIDINGGTGTYDINEGTSVTIEFSPFDYQKVEAVTFNGTDITTDLTSPYESSYVRTYTFAMTGDATVNVTYRSIYDYINITSTGPGTTYYEAYGSTESLTDGQDGRAEIEDGTDYTITCTPDNGYSILSVVVNDVDMTAQLEDSPTGGDGKVLTLSNVTENKTVVVTYGTPTPEAYARLTEDSTQVLSQGATGIVYAKKLTFYYDTNKGDGDYAVTTFANYGSRGWDGVSGEVTSVVFDDSFASYAPTSTAYWFYGMTSLTSVSGLEWLSTDAVTTMSSMFERCSALTTLDLSNFQTSRVTNMANMFAYCSNLATIFVGSGWSTEAVQYSANMFVQCTSLAGGKGTTVTSTGADYARIDGGTSNPGYLTDVDAPRIFNVNVKIVGIGNVTATYSSNQTFIYSNSDNDISVARGEAVILAITPNTGYALGSVMLDTLDVTSQVAADSTGVYFYTLSRVYDEHAVTVTFVNNTPEAYAALSENNTVLTFYYDTNKDVRNGMSVGPFSRSSECGWYSQVTTIQSVVFDDSFVNCRPTSTSYWFAGATTLNSITGLSNLNTSEVTSMSNMFYNCVSLGSLDLSGFNTDNVTDMSAMFAESHIYSLNISSFNTANVTTMRRMFYNTYMTELDVHHFNTANVTDMNSMFGLCEYITSLDLSSFNTSKVENMGSMFVTCERLSNLDISSFSTENVTDMSGMFYNCKALGTIDLGHFTTGNVTNMSNMFNHCEGLTMLDLSQFNTANVTNMQGMFSYAKALTSVNLSSFNTSKVTDMRNMFVGCSALTTLDLGSFNTESVRDMIGTFQGCSSLTTINVSSLWSTTALTSSSFGRSMFSDCTNLVGGAGTTYDAEHTDYTYAHIDEGETNPGYLTDINAATEYDVLVTVVGNGSVSIGSGTIAGGTAEHITMPAGGTMTLNITPDTGYALGSLMLDTLDVTSQVSADSTGVLTYTLSRIYDTHTVTVTFVNDTDEPYAVLDGNTLTFYYDKQKEARGGTVVGADTGISGISNASAGETVTSVVFDQSMANCTTITNTASWFSNFTQLSRITGLEYLNTSNVTSMNNMFYNCSQLSDIDLSHFDTGRVTDMGGMFMQCSSLTTLDLTSFSTAAVTNMIAMFMDCSNLETITVGQGWTTSSLEMSSSMFSGCTSLKGSKGTTYDAEHTDATYAHIDEGESNPGYLTDINAATEFDVLVTVVGNGSVSIGSGTIAGGTAEHITMPAGGTMTLNITPDTGYAFSSLMLDTLDVTSQVAADSTGVLTYTLSRIYDPHSITVTFVNNMPEAYARLTGEQGGNRVLTFYYDTNKEDSDYAVEPFASSSERGWQSEGGITRVVFDSSFENATTITSTAYWFNEMNGLTAIEGLQYLNTSNVTNMYAMFYNCSSLASLDVTSFNTQNVTNMESMFGGCRSLTSLDLSSFNTQNVTNMYGMFQDCSSLTSLDLSRFDTQNVTSMSTMFYRCEALASINFGTINTAKVTDMSNMFYGCFSLRSLDLSSFNTQNVTDMSDMFGVCYRLSSLDLSSFDTQRVTNMHNMFNGSYELTAIYVSSSWVTLADTYGDDMFTGCNSLVGGRGTGYDANHVDATYARIDMAPDAPGYFTRRDLLMGDANDDGSVTIADAVATVTNILGEATSEYFSQTKADMNSDSEIDIFDVTLIVNAVLAASPAPAYNGMTSAAFGSIAAEDVRMEAQANSLTLGISGSAQYTAFQFDVTLPEGTTLEGVRLTNKATNHQLAYQKVGDNTYRVVGLSMTNQQLSAANGRLVQLQLSGNADQSSVTMSNVLFVGQPATDATAIREHKADGAADRGAIYDLNGRYVGNDRQKLGKGIYIINHKKVNIK